jgi:hypothetical protein
VLVFNAVLLVLDHGIFGLYIIDLIVEDDELMLLILQLVKFLLEHGDEGIPLHGVRLLHSGVASIHHHNSRYYYNKS